MKIDFNGFDDLAKELKKMEQTAKELEKGEQVSFDILFNPEFMAKYTQFNSFDELLEAGNFVVNSEKDFEAIPDGELDVHVAQTTQFENWQDMLDSAGLEYGAKRLGF